MPSKETDILKIDTDQIKKGLKLWTSLGALGKGGAKNPIAAILSMGGLEWLAREASAKMGTDLTWYGVGAVAVLWVMNIGAWILRELVDIKDLLKKGAKFHEEIDGRVAALENDKRERDEAARQAELRAARERKKKTNSKQAVKPVSDTAVQPVVFDEDDEPPKLDPFSG